MTKRSPPRNRRTLRPPEKPVVKPTEGSLKARRSAARLTAAQVLYQMELNGQDAGSAIREYIDHRRGFKLEGDVLIPAEPDMLSSIVNGVDSRRDDLTHMVTAALEKGGHKPEQIDRLLHYILLAGSYELMAHTDINAPIIISDYINVTHAFYDKGEARLVNAILDGISKAVR